MRWRRLLVRSVSLAEWMDPKLIMGKSMYPRALIHFTVILGLGLPLASAQTSAPDGLPSAPSAVQQDQNKSPKRLPSIPSNTQPEPAKDQSAQNADKPKVQPSGNSESSLPP